MAVLYQRLQRQGVEVEMLTNDFRAANTVRDYGVPTCTTIETVWDIDFVARKGDSLIMDTPEDDGGKLEVYMELFSEVRRAANHCEDSSRAGEEVFFADGMIDTYYTSVKHEEKVERTIFFYGDSDPKKWLKAHLEMFADSHIELLLGEYFYLGYEAELSSCFSLLHESDDYKEVIAHSSHVITCAQQTAYEARAAGAEVGYLCDAVELCDREKLEEAGIKILDKQI